MFYEKKLESEVLEHSVDKVDKFYVYHRRVINIIFVSLLFVAILVMIYLCIASLLDFSFFSNRPLIRNVDILPASLIPYNCNRNIDQLFCPPLTSVLIPGILNIQSARSFYRYGSQILKKTSGSNTEKITGIKWTEWTLFDNNSANDVTISVIVTLPTQLFIGICSNEDYLLEIFGQSGYSNQTISTYPINLTSLQSDEFINELRGSSSILNSPKELNNGEDGLILYFKHFWI